MIHRDVIVVGASAGGIEALIELVSLLPADLPAAVLICVHLSPTHKSVLPRILSGSGPLPATHAQEGEAMLPSRIYIAPPDRHLLVDGPVLRVTTGPMENGHRPAIDPLFRTAARSHGANVIGIILSGSLDDGTAGLGAVKQRGGVCIVQDPNEAIVADMPRNALQKTEVDHCLPIRDMGRLLLSLVREELLPGPGVPVPALVEHESRIALDSFTQGVAPPGQPSAFGCPSCGGVLWEVLDGDLLRFRCRVGHAFGTEGLHAEQQAALEGALWAALRALEEQASLTRRMAARARELKHAMSANRYDQRAQSTEHQARLVREALNRGIAAEPAEG